MKLRNLVFILIIICNNISAQFENLKIEYYSYKDGLTASGVNNVIKDSKGFIWLCTNNGLFRFDGYSFRNLNSLIESSFNLETYSIIEDSDHNFLIGTVNGIYYYNTHVEKIFPLQFHLNNSTKVYQILLYQQKLWAATNNGLIIINAEKPYSHEVVYPSQQILPDPEIKRTSQDNIINTLYFSPDYSTLWVGTNGALYELNPKTLDIKHVESYFQNSIRKISPYNSNLIVSSWDGGVFIIDPIEHKMIRDKFIAGVNKVVGDKRVRAAVFDNQHRLWVATYGNGLFIFKKNKADSIVYANYRNEQGQNPNLKSDFINRLYIDNEGIVWLSTLQPTLSKVYFRKNNIKYYNLPLQNIDHKPKEILALNQSTIDNNKIWVPTNGGGIYLFDAKKLLFRQFTDSPGSELRLQSNNITLCFQDKAGNLWIVYQRLGLYVVPAKAINDIISGNNVADIRPIDANRVLASFFIANSYITSFYEDSKNRLWIGLWGGLYLVEPKTGNVEFTNNRELLDSYTTTCIFSGLNNNKYNFPVSPILSVTEISTTKYWINTDGAGVVEVELDGKERFTVNKLAFNKQLPSNFIRFVYRDSKNKFWIGTNAGLGYWNQKSDKMQIIQEKDGLMSGNINNIIEDASANIWISTSYGISRINSANLAVTNYFNNDYENYNLYIPKAASLTPEGNLCFSTNEAIAVLNPDSVNQVMVKAPLYFTDIKIDNKTIIPLEKYYGTTVINTTLNNCKTINVPFNHTLSIEFAALDFLNPEQVSYKYKIANNTEWILLSPGQRNLTLPNMSPGEYTLSIIVANKSENSSIRNIRINYLPPFWRTRLAYFIYILLILTLLFTYRKLLIQRLAQKSIIDNERFERKKLEELDRMKSEFFSNISHEFRTPLSLIISPLEKLLKEEDIQDRNKEKINLVLKSSNRLLKLTNELMDFSKIEKNLLVPEFQFVNIVLLVNELSQPFQNLADSMNLDFKIICSFDRIEIPIDKGMIEKVIFNLLSNAFKYTSANGMVMLNLTKSQISNTEYLKLSVVNTGEGIDKASINKIFDRFYQVNNLQNKKIEGTGIGLSIVKSYVELHKGIVEVKSEINLETCFDVYLPLSQDNVIVSESEMNKSLIGANELIISPNKINTIKPLSQFNVLVIEDDQDIRDYIVDELSFEYKILSAANGDEGLQMANQAIPDLIITDVMMPGISGYELCNILKNQVVTSHIPILVLSAKAAVNDQIEGLEMGADVYMVKPFNIDHLKSQIKRLISFKETVHSRYINETSLVPQGSFTTKLDEDFMRKVMAFIEDNITNSDLSVDQLANCVSLSKVQTYRKIKAISGMTIVEFIRTIRLKKAAQMIGEGQYNFSEIAFEAGFSTPSYFTKCFHDHFGKTPSEYANELG